MIPSIKTLAIIAYERAKELHAVLAIETRHDLECFLALATTPDGKPRYQRTWDWYRSCYNPPSLTHAKLTPEKLTWTEVRA